MNQSRDSIEPLLRMANDIADYFASEPDHEAAVDGMVQHLMRFWGPRMRRRIRAHFDSGGSGLSTLAIAAVGRLAAID